MAAANTVEELEPVTTCGCAASTPHSYIDVLYMQPLVRDTLHLCPDRLQGHYRTDTCPRGTNHALSTPTIYAPDTPTVDAPGIQAGQTQVKGPHCGVRVQHVAPQSAGLPRESLKQEGAAGTGGRCIWEGARGCTT